MPLIRCDLLNILICSYDIVRMKVRFERCLSVHLDAYSILFRLKMQIYATILNLKRVTCLYTVNSPNSGIFVGVLFRFFNYCRSWLLLWYSATIKVFRQYRLSIFLRYITWPLFWPLQIVVIRLGKRGHYLVFSNHCGT